MTHIDSQYLSLAPLPQVSGPSPFASRSWLRFGFQEIATTSLDCIISSIPLSSSAETSLDDYPLASWSQPDFRDTAIM